MLVYPKAGPIPFITFNSGSFREYPNVSRPKTRPGIRQSRMPVLSRDWEEDVPECWGREISGKFLVLGKCHSGTQTSITRGCSTAMVEYMLKCANLKMENERTLNCDCANC